MKPILTLKRWICIWVLIYSQFTIFSFDVAAQEPTTEPNATPVTAAQEPTAVPTPTSAPTWTPAPSPTDPPGNGGSTTPTPTPVSGATPTGRTVDFRADSDEVDSGECVQFSWMVRGDIDRVEFDLEDDEKDPLLVSEQDEREECPTEDSTYQLSIRWLDGAKTNRELEIDVHTGSSDGSGSNSNGGSGSATASGGAGEFIVVTPILMTTGTPTPQSVAMAPANTETSAVQPVAFAETAGGQPVVPAGLLSSVNALPETGALPAPAVSPEANLMTGQPRWALWLAFGVGFVLLLGNAGLVLLVKFLRQTSPFKL